MRDELDELTTDASARKKATDWLMQVISARKPINLQLNSSALEEDGESAVAVAEPVNEPETVKWAGEFSAEDLCGSPAVPVIKVEPAVQSEAIEVTADDVCWVPEENRLKPEPVAEPVPKVLQMTQPGRESQPEVKIKQPEPKMSPTSPMTEAFFGKTALAAEPAMHHLSMNDGVSIEDISREPAPYVVEPIWNSFGGGFYIPEADERPITDADISRDWVIESMEPGGDRGKDGVVLPFSFKVLKPKEAEATEAETSAAGAAEAAEGEATGAVVLDQKLNEVASIEESAEVAAEPEAVVSDTAAEAEAADTAQTAESVAEEAPVAEVAAERVVEAEAVESEAVAPEAEEALAEAGKFVAEEAQEEIAAEADGEHQPESVFAHAGFWEDSVPGVVAAEAHSGDEELLDDEEPLDMDVNRPVSAPAAENGDIDTKWPKEWVAAWQTLLRFGAALPWMARSLPALEAGSTGEGTDVPGEMRQDVAGLRLVQYEIRTTVQDHTLHLKRMDEQLGRIREAMESRASDSGELVESVKTMTKLVRVIGAGLGGLVAVLILLVSILLAR